MCLFTLDFFFSPELLCHMLSIFCFFLVTFVRLNSFKKALSNLADSSAFEPPQVREFTINPQCGPERFSKGILQHAAQKLHFPCCAGLETRRAALMFWFLRCHRFVSPPRCHGTLNQEDSFWSQALQDLETCGQSEILRELEASMTGSALSLYLEETKTNEDSMFQSEISPIKREGIHGESKNKSNPNMLTGARDVPSRGKGDPSDILSPTTLALHKVTIRKDLESHDFGFSVSDGLLEKGVYVNMIRPDGPADLAGLKPFDRILQVNRVRTRDLDCCLTVPLIIEAGDSLDLVISRNPLAAADTGLPDDCDDPSNPLFCFPERRTNSIAL